MGLDLTLNSIPKDGVEEEQYWRKNWVAVHFFEMENVKNKEVDVDDMNNYLEALVAWSESEETMEGGEGWDEENILDEISTVKSITKKMEENRDKRTYYYHPWW